MQLTRRSILLSSLRLEGLPASFNRSGHSIATFLNRLFLLIYELAGIVGVDPGPLTARELFFMAEGRSRAAWERTSAIMALIANANRDRKRKPSPYKPDDFNPFAKKQKRAIKLESLAPLRSAFEKFGRR